MTDILRPHAKILTDALQAYYPKKQFNVLNYGFGSTSILSIDVRYELKNEYQGENYPAIKETPFDIIFIESFGYNPLSQYSLKDGLKIQEQELANLYNKLVVSHPESIIVFMTTIAPNKELFASNTVELSNEDRLRWVNERISYLTNLSDVARKNDILLLDLYSQTLDEKGDGNLTYISDHDYIHPSSPGVYFIYQKIADFIHSQKLIP